MRYRHLLTSALVLLAGILLTACGFALRGSAGEFRIPFDTIHINKSTTTYFGATLKRNLETAGTRVVQDKKAAEALLEIRKNKREREVLSLTTAGRVREYALFYTLEFQVRDNAGKILLEPVQIRLRRTQTYSETEAYAKEKEADMLYEEMENDTMQQIIRRLVNIKETDNYDDEPGL